MRRILGTKLWLQFFKSLSEHFPIHSPDRFRAQNPNLTVEAKNALSDFVYDVNHKLMGDFVSMSNDEILRFQKMEKLLENKISRRFKIRRLDKDDFGYLIEHLYGQTGTAYEEYEYHLSKKKLDNETLIKYYDLIKPTRCLDRKSVV